MPSYEQFQSSGRTPLRVYNKQPTYEIYKSPYGPAYKHQPNIMGLTFPKAVRYFFIRAFNEEYYLPPNSSRLLPLRYNRGSIASGFAVAGGIFAVFFFGEVPKVRKDILSHLPVIGEYFVKEIPPEDNPF